MGSTICRKVSWARRRRYGTWWKTVGFGPPIIGFRVRALLAGEVQVYSSPLGFVADEEGYGEANGTLTSPNVHGESFGYHFAYWTVNGVRQAGLVRGRSIPSSGEDRNHRYRHGGPLRAEQSGQRWGRAHGLVRTLSFRGLEPGHEQ